MSPRATTSQGSPERLAAKARHIGLSLLPLGVFVAGALGYEQVKASGLSINVTRGAPRSASPAPAVRVVTAPSPDGVAAGVAPAVVNGAPLRRPPVALPDLRDQRSLLELASVVMPPPAEPILAVIQSAPVAPIVPAVAAEPIVPVVLTGRTIDLHHDGAQMQPLHFTATTAEGPGAYAILRGVPPNAALSHGISVGDDTWLIDGGDVISVAIALRAGASAERVPLEFTLLSGDSRVLAQEKLTLAVLAPPAPVLAVRPADLGVARSPNGNSPSGTLQGASSPTSSPIVTATIPPPAPAPPQQPIGLPLATTAAATRAPDPKAQELPALTRGRRMLEIGNIAAARPLLLLAAGEGSGDAAALLAASYDPAWLKKAGVVGAVANPDAAARWFAEAVRLGTTDPARATELPR